MHKNYVEGATLFNSLLLQLSESEYHVSSAPTSPETTLCFWDNGVNQLLQSVCHDFCKDLACYGEECKTSIVATVMSVALLENSDNYCILEILWNLFCFPEMCK